MFKCEDCDFKTDDAAGADEHTRKEDHCIEEVDDDDET